MEKVFFERNNKGKPYLPYVARNQSIFNYLPHYHAEVEIILLRQGRTILTVDGSCILLTSGDIFVVSPNKIHGFRSSIKNDLYIMKLYTPNCLLDYNLNLHIKIGTSLHTELSSILNDLIQESEHSFQGREIAMTLHANRFFLTLIRKADLSKRSDSDRADVLRFIELSTRILDYLENHYAEDVSLEDLADHCGCSRFSLSREFKKITTLSFYELLASFRIEKAKELLKKQMGVLETAMICGFNNQRSFNRSFKQYVGMTPTAYIQQIKKPHGISSP